jgi:hypothetical protein
VAADLADLVRRPPLNWPVLVVDQTGVGQAVVDCLAKSQLCASLEPITWGCDYAAAARNAAGPARSTAAMVVAAPSACTWKKVSFTALTPAAARKAM